MSDFDGEYGLHVSDNDKLHAKCERLERENSALQDVVRKLVLDQHGIDMRIVVDGVENAEVRIREAVAVGAQALARILLEKSQKLGELYRQVALYRNAVSARQLGGRL